MSSFSICSHIIKQKVHSSGKVSDLGEHVFTTSTSTTNAAIRKKRPHTVHSRCMHTSVPVSFIAKHQANAATMHVGSNCDSEPHLNNFSIANFVRPTKFSRGKLREVESLFTKKKFDLKSHVGFNEDMTDARAQSGKWFDRVVLFRNGMGERFSDTYKEDSPTKTFSNLGYTAESVRLLNELASVRFVTQKLSQAQQRRHRDAGKPLTARYTSLYPNL